MDLDKLFKDVVNDENLSGIPLKNITKVTIEIVKLLYENDFYLSKLEMEDYDV